MEHIHAPKSYLSQAELLAQAAEEAAELAQALLHLRRAYDGTNPTRTDRKAAVEAVNEELGDLRLSLEQLDCIDEDKVHMHKMRKLARWLVALMDRK